jgi:hypothetical protein
MGMSRTKGERQDQRGCSYRTGLKSRVSQNDGDTAEDETEKAECIDPVGPRTRAVCRGASKVTTFWASPARLASSAI